MRLVFRSDLKDQLLHDAATAEALRPVALKVAAKVKAPKDQVITTRAGRGRRGAFAQVIMSGPRAVYIEFGTRTQKALMPLRRAVFSTKGVHQ